MTTQDRMFDAPVELDAPLRSAKDGIIRCADLIHSIVACHRVEDAIWQRLNLEANNRKAEVLAALDSLGAPPVWCEREAWERIANSMRSWSIIFGNLELYWQLRRKRDE